MKKKENQTNQLYFNTGFFLLSTAVLLLELAQARVFSVMLWHHLSYMVITIALLGFGCAGTIVCVWWRQLSANPQKTILYCCCLFSLFTVLSFFTVIRIPLCTLKFGFFNLIIVFLYYLLFFLPYLAAGIVVSLVMSTAVKKVNLLYCINMTGSGFGCLCMIILISPLGGEATIMVSALLSSIAALFFSLGKAAKTKFCLLGLSIVMAIFTCFASRIFPVSPAPYKALSVYQKNKTMFPGLKTEFSKWNAISRIDVVSANKTSGQTHVLELNRENKNLLVDGDAYTAIENHPVKNYLTDGRPAFHMYTVPYMIKKNPRVLIIGLGGGNDVFTAQLMGASRITGCEINNLISDLVKNRYSKFVGDIYNKKNTKIYTAEGRSFVRRSKEKYDLIIMTAVDTWAGLSSGAYVLSENYLYTKDAFFDYMDCLDEDGLLCITRLFFSPPREVLRLVSTAARVLSDRGILNPAHHIAVVSVVGGGLAAVLVKKTPFTEQELDTLIQDRYYDPEAKIVFAGGRPLEKLNPGLMGENLSLLKTRAKPFHKLFQSWKTGKQDAFFNSYLFDITPVTDNSPFFFEFYRWKNFFLDMKGAGFGGWGGDTIRPVALLILGGSVIQALFLSFVFILGPLLLFKRQKIRFKRKAFFITYFLCLGFAYMVLEIVLMQKLVLFLGHPIYSISVVLSSFLVFSGVGSLVSGQFKWDEKKTVFFSIIFIVIYGSILVFGLQKIITVFIEHELIARAAIVWLVLFPLAFFMGMPFPAGLKAGARVAPELVPWAIGINACASVTASILIIVIAMGVGFNAALVLGLTAYVAGLVFFMFGRFSTQGQT